MTFAPPAEAAHDRWASGGAAPRRLGEPQSCLLEHHPPPGSGSPGPGGVEVALYEGLADLPHVNPDLDDPYGRWAASPAVADLRSRLAASDGALISSSEYAHVVPGVLKNALDWVVGSGELYEKPVAVINLAMRHARPGVAGGDTQDDGRGTGRGGVGHCAAPETGSASRRGLASSGGWWLRTCPASGAPTSPKTSTTPSRATGGTWTA
ncbi:MAG: NAD(P)H-dependent oxidoreductase [Actinobacteria bacterium]|nr:NAD(P)H-dependent oxidoreductase [Actinomycetota bacterium]